MLADMRRLHEVYCDTINRMVIYGHRDKIGSVDGTRKSIEMDLEI